MLRDATYVESRRVASTGYSPRATLHRSCRSRGAAGVEKENEGDETGGGIEPPTAVFAPARRTFGRGWIYLPMRNKGIVGIVPDKKLTITRGWRRKGEMCSESLANEDRDYGV